jgi:hypothetical protein
MVSGIFYVLAAVTIVIIFCVRKWLIPSSASFVAGQAEISGLISQYRTGNILVFVLSDLSASWDSYYSCLLEHRAI